MVYRGEYEESQQHFLKDWIISKIILKIIRKTKSIRELVTCARKC